MPKFTDLYIDKLPFSKDRIEVYDSLLPAFGCRVGARTKTWLVVDSAGSRHKLGQYPSMTLAEARTAARTHMRDQLPRSDLSLQEATAAYLEAIDVRPNTHRFYRLFLDKLAHKHGKLPINALTTRLVAETIETPHMHLACKVFFTWCKRHELMEKNPLENIRNGRFTSRSRILSDDELKRVWQASKSLNEFGVVVRLCILTGQRRGELSAIQPKNYSPSLMTFPPALTKNKREHSIPITSTSFALLQQYTKRCAAWSKPKKKLDELSGVTDWVLHDLRRTFRSTMGKIGIAPHLPERIVNHVSAQTEMERIYDRHSYLPEMRQALEKYETHLAVILGEPLV
jgi:integrase